MGGNADAAGFKARAAARQPKIHQVAVSTQYNQRLTHGVALTQPGVAVTELLIAVATFLCLIGAVYAGAVCNVRLAARDLPEGTLEIVGQTANIFLVTTSVVLGLMLNSAKTTFETNDRNIHALATELILLDRSVRGLGPGAEETHRHLVDYVQRAIEQPHILQANLQAEAVLDAAGASLRSIRTSDDQVLARWNDARQLFRQVVRLRWVSLDAAGGAIPAPLVVMLIAWLALIFASLGFRAPRNTVVTTAFLVAAVLLSSTLYLILEMDTPATGLVMEVSNAPFQRALEVLQAPQPQPASANKSETLAQ